MIFRFVRILQTSLHMLTRLLYIMNASIHDLRLRSHIASKLAYAHYAFFISYILIEAGNWPNEAFREYHPVWTETPILRDDAGAAF